MPAYKEEEGATDTQEIKGGRVCVEYYPLRVGDFHYGWWVRVETTKKSALPQC